MVESPRDVLDIDNCSSLRGSGVSRVSTPQDFRNTDYRVVVVLREQETARELMDSIKNSNGEYPYQAIPIAVTAVSSPATPNTLNSCNLEMEPEKAAELLREQLECGLAAGAETMIWFTASDQIFWQCGFDAETGTQIRKAALERSVEAAQQSAELVETLYRSGLTDFQNVLDHMMLFIDDLLITHFFCHGLIGRS